jgi:uncharacterized protein (DUF427 family)
MTTRTVKIPSAEHPITIVPNPNQIIVRSGGKVVATTRRSLTLTEASYAPVHYIPRADVDLSLLEANAHTTYCPFKGDCTYYSIPAGGEKAVNAVWTYEDPFDAVAAIKDHIAFYPDRVDAIEETR